MSTSAQYASTPKVGSAILSIADTSLTTPTSVGTIVSAGTSGTRIDYINAISLGSSVSGLVNLFIYDGTTYDFWQQIAIQTNTTSTTASALNAIYSSNNNSNVMPLTLPTGYSLRATVTTNQVIANPSEVSVSASASVASGAYATLTTAASTAAIAALATVSNTYFTFTTTPYVMTNPAQVTLTSAANQSAITFTIRGLDATGASITETVTGPNATTVYSANVYSVVTSVYSGGAMTGTTSVGYGSTYSFAVVPSKITQTSGSTSNTGVTWTVTGINNAGSLITESLTGAGIGLTVTSTNTYRAITSIKASASATAAAFGNPVVPSGIRVTAYGGDF